MNDGVTMSLGFLTGAGAGGVFLWSLAWTVGRLPTSRRPCLWMLGGFLFRMTVVMGIFVAIATRGDWRLLLAAGLGFALIRTVGVRIVARRGLCCRLAFRDSSQVGSLSSQACRFRQGVDP